LEREFPKIFWEHLVNENRILLCERNHYIPRNLPKNATFATELLQSRPYRFGGCILYLQELGVKDYQKDFL